MKCETCDEIFQLYFILPVHSLLKRLTIEVWQPRLFQLGEEFSLWWQCVGIIQRAVENVNEVSCVCLHHQKATVN